MMRYVYKFSAISVLALLPAFAHAGSPGGLHIIAIPAASAVAYTPAIKVFFDGYNSRDISGDCGEATLAVDHAYYDGNKAGITGDFAIKAMRSKPTHRKLGKLMGAFRHPQHQHGFDAALAYEVKGQTLVFYGISQYTNVNKYASPIALADVNDMVKLTRAICVAVARLPVRWDG